ncbi:MAG: redoxin family protein [Nitriliruptoraceae bacterium]
MRLRWAWIGVCVALLAGCGSDTISVADVAPPERIPPVDAELADGGWPETAAWIRRELEAGRPVIVNIFASWCVPCQREMPLVLETARAHDDVAFLGIDHLDQRDNGARFLEEYSVDIPTIYDVAGDVAAAVQARGMPTTVAFDLDGELVVHHTGELTQRALDEMVATITR